MSNPLCIYHGNCADGFTAAWVVWKRFQGRFEYHPGVHQNPPPDVTGRDVVIVDFSYKRPVLDAMAQTAKSITILDHHKSAQEDLAAFTVSLCGSARFVHEDLAGVWRDMEELGRPKIVAEFDMARSGAQMTWDFFCPDLSQRPALVDYVGDRDLWKFNLPCSREVNAFVFAHEYTFENWDHLDRQLRDHMDVQRVADMGAAIEKKHHKDVAELVANNRRKMVIGGHVAPVANIPYTLASDAGHLLCEPIDEGLHGLWVPPFGVCYWDTPEGRVFSLRSTDAGLDVSEVAKGYGGGGHRNASGFRMPIGWEGDNG